MVEIIATGARKANEGKWLVMKIYIGESDKAVHGKFHGKPLWESLMHDFKERGMAGTTIYRAIAGFGATAQERSALSEWLSTDLPTIVEVIDTEENIQRII